MTEPVEKVKKQVKIWDWAARVLPLFAVSGIIFCHYFDYTDARDLLIRLTLLGFLFSAIVWWWWAIYKIAWLAELYSSITQKLSDIKAGTSDLKKDIKDSKE